jgi:hypothetical protein
MSDRLLALSVSVSLLIGLSLWVPALDLFQRLLSNYSRHDQKD